MITRVQVKNFRNLADIDVQLGSLTVLVGRNGTGKSTFLDVLRFVRDALRLGFGKAIDQRDGFHAMCSWCPDRETNDIEISLEITEDGYAARYSFVIGVGRQGILQVKHEVTEVPSSLQQSVVCFETEDGKWVKTPTDYLNSSMYSLNMPVAVDALMLPRLSLVLGDLQTVLDDVTSTNFYTIFPNTLKLPQPHYVSEARLLEDGRNLATILRRIIRQKNVLC